MKCIASTSGVGLNQLIIVIGLFVFLTTSACQEKPEQPVVTPVDKEQIKKTIQEKENHYAELYSAGDVGKLDYYADDAIVYAQNKKPLIGKDSIQAYLQDGLAASSPGNKISFVTEDIRIFNDANQVLEIGSFRLVDSVDVLINSGHYMILFEKRDGKYVSVREMSTSDVSIPSE